MKTEVVGIAIATVIVLSLIIWGVRTLDGSSQSQNGTPANQVTMTEDNMPSGGDLQIEVLNEGKGETLTQKGNIITVHYRGTLTNGDQFDASYDRGQPFTFQLGAGQVIRGWDQGLEGMKVGEKRRLTIPSELGYGAQEIPGKIPANSTLIFEVELLSIEE